MATLRGSDGSVLIPCDASGRVLEVALLLDAFWAREKWVGGAGPRAEAAVLVLFAAEQWAAQWGSGLLAPVLRGAGAHIHAPSTLPALAG